PSTGSKGPKRPRVPNRQRLRPQRQRQPQPLNNHKNFMSRRRQATKKPLAEDAKYHSALVTRLVNTVMIGGKKTVAQRIVYGAFDEIATKNPNTNPLEILQRAVDNAKPRLEVKPRRVGGATYQVPMEVP